MARPLTSLPRSRRLPRPVLATPARTCILGARLAVVARQGDEEPDEVESSKRAVGKEPDRREIGHLRGTAARLALARWRGDESP